MSSIPDSLSRIYKGERDYLRMPFKGSRVYKNAFLYIYQANLHDTESAHAMRGKRVYVVILIENWACSMVTV